MLKKVWSVVAKILFIFFCLEPANTTLAMNKELEKTKGLILLIPGMLSTPIFNKENNDEIIWIIPSIFFILNFPKKYNKMCFDDYGVPINKNVVAANYSLKETKNLKTLELAKYGVGYCDKKVMDTLKKVFGPETEYGWDIVRLPYDWRESCLKTAKELAKLVEEYNGKEMYIVAFSQGGLLLVFALLNYLTKDQLSKIKRCIFVASPLRGTFEPLYVMFNGIRTGSGFLDLISNIVGIKSATKDLSHNFHSMYELLPSEKLHNVLPSNLPKFRVLKQNPPLNSYEDMTKAIENANWYTRKDGTKKEFLKNAKDLQTKINEYIDKDLLNDCKCFFLLGKGKDTMCRLCFDNTGKLSIAAVADGDGTVICAKAFPENTDPSTIFYFDGVAHTEMLNDERVIEKIIELIKAAHEGKKPAKA